MRLSVLRILSAYRLRRTLILLVSRAPRLLSPPSLLPALVTGNSHAILTTGGWKRPPVYFFGEPAAVGADVDPVDGDVPENSFFKRS